MRDWLISSRRHFLQVIAKAGSVAPAAAWIHSLQASTTPNERLNLGFIGASGQGALNLAALATENVVAICDVDLTRVSQAKKAFPNAAVYQDFRKLLDHGGIDAVVVSTPDHMHAIPVQQALMLGMHVFCEQPLTHSVYEARKLRQSANTSKKITQVNISTRQLSHWSYLAKVIRGGTFGQVRHVHAWHPGRPVPCNPSQAGMPPPTLDYNLWLGPSQFRPYDPSHCHYLWRYWWEFGGGVLAEQGCNFLDLAIRTLDLQAPFRVQAEGEKYHQGANPVPGQMKVDYWFHTHHSKEPIQITWYHGGLRPPIEEFADRPLGLVFETEKGVLYTAHESYELGKNVSVELPATFDQPLASLQDDWTAAIKAGRQSCCSIEDVAPLTEAVLLGNVAYRTNERRIDWDVDRMQAANAPDAAALIQPEYRSGWSL